MTDSLSYSVDQSGTRQAYDITTVIDGWDSISYSCKSLLHRTVDFEVNGKFRTVWNDDDQIPQETPFLYINSDGQISFGMTQEEYGREAQVMFETDDL
jgi:hypothetical protein